VIVKLQLALLPLASVFVQATVVNPLAKVDPLGGTQSRLAPGQLSPTTGAKATVWPQTPGAVLVTMLAGQVIVGGSGSLTVTVKLQLVVFPELSVAVQCTVVIPLAKVLPFVGLQLTLTPGQLSLAVVAKFTTWLH